MRLNLMRISFDTCNFGVFICFKHNSETSEEVNTTIEYELWLPNVRMCLHVMERNGIRLDRQNSLLLGNQDLASMLTLDNMGCLKVGEQQLKSILVRSSWQIKEGFPNLPYL